MDSVALGIGSINPECFEIFFEELNVKGILREAQERKNENIRRRKRKDLLRLQLLRIIEISIFRGLLRVCSLVDRHTGRLSPLIADLFESTRINIESDVDREQSVLQDTKVYKYAVNRFFVLQNTYRLFCILSVFWCGCDQGVAALGKAIVCWH